MTSRRGFLGALLAIPAVARLWPEERKPWTAICARSYDLTDGAFRFYGYSDNRREVYFAREKATTSEAADVRVGRLLAEHPDIPLDDRGYLNVRDPRVKILFSEPMNWEYRI